MLYLDNNVYQLGFYVSTPGEKIRLFGYGAEDWLTGCVSRGRKTIL